MPSITDLCNDALGQIGSSFITALDDGTNPANLCNRFYPTVRDAVLRDHLWNFAMTRVALARNATAPVSEWTYGYTLPANCLRVVRLGLSDDIRWKIEGRNLVTDESSATILYVARIEDPNIWDTLFYQALATRLASKLATPLTGKVALAVELYKLYDAMISDARAVDGQEGISDPMDSTDLTDVRFD